MTRFDYATLDAPPQSFIDAMRARYPTEVETDRLLARKLERRRAMTETYVPPTLDELADCVRAYCESNLEPPFEIASPRWLSGGASKLQIMFELTWRCDGEVRRDTMVLRMDPAESANATSREREAELICAFEGVIPGPHVFFLDAEARWFPEPALIYSFSAGVTKPTGTRSGAVSGLGTHFPPGLRDMLAPQFVDHLARIHTFDLSGGALGNMDRPAVGTTEAALLQLNRARRVWEEDRGEDHPLMEVTVAWLERHLPVLDHLSVVHGDFRSGNFLFDEASGQITAWLDWERGHLGDRHRDLAWTTQAMFGYPREDGAGFYVCGLLCADDFYEQYQRASGLSIDPERMRWYSILNCYQVLVTTLGSAYRVVRLGSSHQEALMVILKGEAAMCTDRLRRLLAEVV